jgi:hypothetical protein
MTIGTYRGRKEQDPGKMIYRHKGSFSHEEDARAAQVFLSVKGIKSKVIKYTDGYSLYVLAPHNFWGKSFILKKR